MHARHALGWPPGGIRAHSGGDGGLGLVCTLTCYTPQPEKPIPIPAYLLYLLFLILGHYFASRGYTAAASPTPGIVSHSTCRVAVFRLLLAAGLDVNDLHLPRYSFTDPVSLSDSMGGFGRILKKDVPLFAGGRADEFLCRSVVEE